MDKYERRRRALKALVDSLGRGGIKRVAEAIDKAPDYVSRMLYDPKKPGKKSIGEDSWDLLITAFPADLDERAQGVNEPSTPNYASVASSETRAGYVRYQDVGQGGAGPGVINPDYPEVLREVEIAEWQVRQELGRVPPPSRVKLLTVRGESMAPRIRSGDVVFVDIEDQSPHDGGLFVIVLHGHALVKRLEIRTDGLHIVSLAAPERPDIVPPNEMDALHIAGRVLGAIQLRKAEDLQ